MEYGVELYLTHDASIRVLVSALAISAFLDEIETFLSFIFSGKKVCELGGGMSSFAGNVVIAY